MLIADIFQRQGHELIVERILADLDWKTLLAASTTCTNLNKLISTSSRLQLILRHAYYALPSVHAKFLSEKTPAKEIEREIDVQLRWATLNPKRIDVVARPHLGRSILTHGLLVTYNTYLQDELDEGDGGDDLVFETAPLLLGPGQPAFQTTDDDDEADVEEDEEDEEDGSEDDAGPVVIDIPDVDDIDDIDPDAWELAPTEGSLGSVPEIKTDTHRFASWTVWDVGAARNVDPAVPLEQAALQCTFRPGFRFLHLAASRDENVVAVSTTEVQDRSSGAVIVAKIHFYLLESSTGQAWGAHEGGLTPTPHPGAAKQVLEIEVPWLRPEEMYEDWRDRKVACFLTFGPGGVIWVQLHAPGGATLLNWKTGEVVFKADIDADMDDRFPIAADTVLALGTPPWTTSDDAAPENHIALHRGHLCFISAGDGPRSPYTTSATTGVHEAGTVNLPSMARPYYRNHPDTGPTPSDFPMEYIEGVTDLDARLLAATVWVDDDSQERYSYTAIIRLDALRARMSAQLRESGLSPALSFGELGGLVDMETFDFGCAWAGTSGLRAVVVSHDDLERPVGEDDTGGDGLKIAIRDYRFRSADLGALVHPGPLASCHPQTTTMDDSADLADRDHLDTPEFYLSNPRQTDDYYTGGELTSTMFKDFRLEKRLARPAWEANFEVFGRPIEDLNVTGVMTDAERLCLATRSELWVMQF